ncbi:PREDICTED: uncharacterized protein LOC109115245 [Nelumbo nucifera]|uniref:Uncharacterized protein LOC109115245 n=1 Tax=Nelumbo nucifera TaxID=4432 RepID=A0A1U8Q7K7_NELNU|nr:PREDICTED: uncharacterized protein LOC109115245 [Nelumbo nucifera]
MTDYSLFTKQNDTSYTAAIVYVDDVIVAGNDPLVISFLKAFLNEHFGIKDIGPPSFFLDLEVTRTDLGIFLSQEKYIRGILQDTGMIDFKPAPTPMECQRHFTDSSSPSLTDPTQYRQLVGRLVYLTIIRPDLCFAVNCLSQFLHDPNTEHLDVALRVVRYLKGTSSFGIFMAAQNDLILRGFCDSDWSSCPLTRHSTTSYITMLGNSPISWKTKKQHTVSHSSAEAEYRAMAVTTSELLWLKRLLAELTISVNSIPLHCDSKTALHIATKPVFHERTKHIKIDCHFVRDHVQQGTIHPQHLPSYNQSVDLFTKALNSDQFHHLLSKLDI